MRIDLVALDLDGTLLDSCERVSARNRAAIRRTLETGTRVVLVTGRGTELPRRISRELNLNMPAICCQGALTKDFGANRTLAHVPIPLNYAKPLVQYGESNGLPMAVYAQECFWRLEASPLAFDTNGPAWRETVTFERMLGEAPTFVRFFGAEAVASVERRFRDFPLTFRHEVWGNFVECGIYDRTASKKNALQRLCADFQILPDNVLAIGDSASDLPMLRWARYGVAMGNARPEVKEGARAVTATNDGDGVALALEHFVFAPKRRPA